MNVSFNLVLQIFLEIILLPFCWILPILILLILNTIMLIHNASILFINNKEEKENVEEIDENDCICIKEIVDIKEVDKQVEKYFDIYNPEMSFLNSLIENFDKENKEIFLEKLINYCHKKLSGCSNDNELKVHAMCLLSLAIKYKNNFKI